MIPQPPTLVVYFGLRQIGWLRLNSNNRLELEYSEKWRAAPDSFAISASLPMDGSYRRGVADHRFFANLLPEADSREMICRSFGISSDNDFELLRRIGGDCAGALSVYPSDQIPQQAGDYRPISQEVLAEAIRTRIPISRLTANGKLRLSLAGAQQKWPVLFKDGNLFFPEGSYASSHILKFASPNLKGVPHNEAYVTFLAGKLGLPVMPVVPFDAYSLTPRYDRFHESSGRVSRYHQEDFCQALGFPPNQKYESEGGPTLSMCAQKLREVSSQPGGDILKLIRWQILNVLLGNSDGHAKNLSLLYKDGGVHLAPLYDLVCTRAYTGLSRDLAMNVGGQSDPGHLNRENWEQMARDLAVRPNLVFHVLRETTELLTSHLADLTHEFSQEFGANPRIDLFRVAIRDQTRRTVTSSLLSKR